MQERSSCLCAGCCCLVTRAGGYGRKKWQYLPDSDTLYGMSTRSLLLRLLLCMTLILNGSGFAVAGSHMSMQHTTSALIADVPSTVLTDCVYDASAVSAAGEHSLPAGHDLVLADCCSESEPCNKFECAIACASGLSAPATLQGVTLGFQPSPQALNLVPHLAGHLAPALRSRYRPPIA